MTPCARAATSSGGCFRSGTITTRTPAACAARAPFSLSSNAMQSSGATPRRAAASRYSAGSGLPCVTSSPPAMLRKYLQHVDVAQPMADLLDAGRRRDRARDAGRVQRLQQRQRARLERKHRRAAGLRQQRLRLGGRRAHGRLAAHACRSASPSDCCAARPITRMKSAISSGKPSARAPAIQACRDGALGVDQQAVHVEDGGLGSQRVPLPAPRGSARPCSGAAERGGRALSPCIGPRSSLTACASRAR